MNPDRIEELLRKNPLPKAPADLKQKLVADIHLPRPAGATQSTNWSRPPSWPRRWLPALSFAAIFLVCVAVVAVQTNILSELQRHNGELRASQQDLSALRAENAEYQKLAADSQELERLRKDNAELLKLRAEVTKLQAQLQDASAVRALNQQLRASAAQANTTGASGDFFGDAKARAERIQCVNNLKQIGLAARIWAGDNKDVYPSNFITMTNELSTWKILQCPTDKEHKVSSWADVAAGNISYIMDAPGISETYPTVVFVECPIHHNICLVDGSVQQLNKNDCIVRKMPDGSEQIVSQVKMIDGKKELVPTP